MLTSPNILCDGCYSYEMARQRREWRHSIDKATDILEEKHLHDFDTKRLVVENRPKLSYTCL